MGISRMYNRVATKGRTVSMFRVYGAVPPWEPVE